MKMQITFELQGHWEPQQVQYEHWEDLKAINPNAFGDLSVENWLDGADDIPLHPGAERFYKEIGVLS